VAVDDPALPHMLARGWCKPTAQHDASVELRSWWLPLGHELLGDLGLSLQPGSPGSRYMRATAWPAANRSPMTAITWRLAAAFCSNTQVGSRSSPARICAWSSSDTGRHHDHGPPLGAHQHAEQPLDPAERPTGGPAEGAVFHYPVLRHRFG
jgi:hypothetical protein